jgi:hypothetical protein
MFNKDKERMLHFKDWKDEDLASIKNPSLIIAGDKGCSNSQNTL